jgi:esterase/lipase
MQEINDSDIKQLPTKRGYKLAYQHYGGKPSIDDGVGIVFLHGHGSDMKGSKAEALMQWAVSKDIEFTRFDLFGHGRTGGDILSATIGQWIEDSCDILDMVTTRKQILVGSSLGGWIMLLLCAYRPQRIASLIGIAAAPDFTKRLIWDILDTEQQNTFRKTGLLAVPNPYSDTDVVYPYTLIQESEKHLILQNPIDFKGPVVLHHGLCDAEVPWQTSIDIAHRLKSENVKIHLDKTATHRYSQTEHIDAIIGSLETLISGKLDAD